MLLKMLSEYKGGIASGQPGSGSGAQRAERELFLFPYFCPVGMYTTITHVKGGF